MYCMQEFSSVTASSYDAESLAPMLTEKASEGWSVVSIVSAGTNVVAYLTRGGGGAAAPASATVASTGFASDDGSGTPAESDIIAIEANDEAAAAVAAEATAISPSLPGEDVPPAEEPVVSTPEAIAAVEESGEPSGWGAVADTPSIPDTPSVPDTPSIPDADDSGFGAVAGGVGIAAGAAAVGGAALAGDTGITSAVDSGTGFADDAAGGATDAVAGAAEHAGAVGDDAMAGASDAAGETGLGLADSIGDNAYEATDTATDTVTDAGTEATVGADVAAEATGDDAASGVPAGWYADPSGRFELRYWDGSAWTEHVSRAGQQYTDPPVA